MQSVNRGTINVEVYKVVEDVALCHISGDFVDGGVIRIPNGPGEYEFTFELDPGTTGVTWAGAPFSSKIGRCPDLGDKLGWLKYTGKSGDQITVEAKAIPSSKAVVHYALHFEKSNGDAVCCDPIIIRD